MKYNTIITVCTIIIACSLLASTYFEYKSYLLDKDFVEGTSGAESETSVDIYARLGG